MGSEVGLEEALTVYIQEYLSSRNFAPRTRTEYGRDIGEVVAFLEEYAGLRTVRQVGTFHLERFLAKLDQKGLGGAIRRRKVASIKSFFAFLTDRSMVLVNPALKLVPPEREQTQPRVLSEQEYKRLIDMVQFHVRDAAIIELLLQTGMRLSEIARLALHDIQLPQRISKDIGNVGSVTIHGKGRKTRTVTLNWKACKALKHYLAERPDTPYPSIFITKFLKPIGSRSIENVVNKYLTEASIYNATVHTLRHTFATHSVKKGTKLDVVRQVLGHTSLKTTSIYVELARDVMDKELQENAL